MAQSSSKGDRRQASDDGDDDSAAGSPTSKRAKPSPGMAEALKLDPEGDAIFAIKHTASDSEETRKFLVSSRVLSLASPVFCKMFSPQHREGTQVRNGEFPFINLEEDDGKAMETILRILHFQSDTISLYLSPAELAKISVHSDKYDCRRALKGRVSEWWHTNKLNRLLYINLHITSE